jgi:hypothetical protein
MMKDTMKTEAWKALSHGARSLYTALRARYNNRLQGGVYLSTRVAVKELGSFSRRDNVRNWFHELQYYGFIAMLTPGHLGVEGKGKAPHWRLTEEWYLGESPTRDYLRWDGEVFHQQKSPGYYTKKKQNPGPYAGASVAHTLGPVEDQIEPEKSKSGPEAGAIQHNGGGPEAGAITSLTTPCLPSDCSEDLTATLEDSSIVPDVAPNNLAPKWTTPELTELEWNDHWFLAYLNKLKTGEDIISKLTAPVT